jgi:hypothetical protein
MRFEDEHEPTKAVLDTFLVEVLSFQLERRPLGVTEGLTTTPRQICRAVEAQAMCPVLDIDRGCTIMCDFLDLTCIQLTYIY